MSFRRGFQSLTRCEALMKWRIWGGERDRHSIVAAHTAFTSSLSLSFHVNARQLHWQCCCVPPPIELTERHKINCFALFYIVWLIWADIFCWIVDNLNQFLALARALTCTHSTKGSICSSVWRVKSLKPFFMCIVVVVIIVNALKRAFRYLRRLLKYFLWIKAP